MKKSQAEIFKVRGRKTPAYIIAHARWQKSRGRKPSESYAGILNPHKALERAYAELAVYHTTCGQHLSNAVTEMIALANFTKRSCSATFNDVTLVADPGMSEDAIAQHYHDVCNRRAEEYRNSPEGKAQAAAMERWRQKLQLQMDQAVEELPSLDLTNLSDVIAWFGKIQDPSDHIHVDVPLGKIVSLFEEAGYVAGANCRENFDENDKENMGRWLIGQALSNLKSVGAIHQIYPHFEKKWRERFAA